MELLDAILTQFGWSAVGWVIAVFVVIHTFIDSSKSRLSHKDVMARFDAISKAYHDAIVDNTKVTERLALLIEERTRQRRDG